MKKLQLFKDFCFDNFSFNKNVKYPKVGDSLWIKFFFIQGLKVSRFYSKSFFGRCISYKRKNSNTSLIILRNIYNREPVELSFFLNSPLIIKTNYKRKDRHFYYNRNKLYYLRKKKISKSKVKF